MEPTLLILAAGMGSRYGGLKQMDPMGPNGETVLDYSVYDAIQAGFKRVVFIIREDFAPAFRKGIGARFEGKIEVEYAFQSLDDLPSGFKVPAGREKPWGTAHAVRAARHYVTGAFAVINADDFYGADAYLRITDYFNKSSKSDDEVSHYCMVGYQINKTLSEHGDVNRGICADENGLLTDVEEITEIKREEDGQIRGNRLDGSRITIPESALASMNFWGFDDNFFSQLEKHFITFLEQYGNEMKSECYIPTVIDDLIRQNLADCRILETTSSWFGVTYPDDKPHVVDAIRQLVDQGAYTSPLG
jgi:dTDP-glucose pyrophosphorylase